MSKESALAFIEKTSSDITLQSRVAALGPSDAAGLVQIAASAGYSLSVEDLKGILSGESELSDDTLERASGGINPQPLPPKSAQSFLRLNPGVLRGIIFVGGRL
ncbi:MAG TPA: Nif11-like leader peptide family RiPP precursor [Thermoanaerobaculia bacterium]